MPATTEKPSVTKFPPTIGEAVALQMPEIKAGKTPAAEPTPNDEQEPEPKPAAKKPDAPAAAPVKESAKPADEPKVDATKEPLNPNLAPAKPEAAKVEAVKPAAADDEEAPKGMTKEAREGWALLRNARFEAEERAKRSGAEVDLLKAQMASEVAKSAPEIGRLKAELEEARKVIAANEDEISIARIESTRQFKEAVAVPMQEVQEIAGRLTTTYDLKPTAIMDAIREADPAKRSTAIEEVTTGFTAFDRDEVIQAARTYAKAQKTGDELRSNAKKKLEEITTRSQQEDEGELTAAAEEYRTSVSAEFKALQAKYPQLRPVEGAQAWNDYLSKLERDAQAVDVNNVSAKDIARSIAAERALPELARIVEHYQKRDKELSAELEKANERIKEYIATEPGAGSGQNGNGASRPAAEGSFGERVVQGAAGR